MIWRLMTVVLMLAATLPAQAFTVIQQTRGATLRDLDLAPVARTLRFDPFVAPPGEHLIGVAAVLEAFINGEVSATNDAVGGTAASRRRDVSATYTLSATVAGNGLLLSDTRSATQTRTAVPGRGNTVRLGDIDPELFDAAFSFGGFAPFLTGPVAFDLQAWQSFAAVAAPDVTYGTPEIKRGHAFLTLIYFSAVPEPATWLLLVSGFGVAGMALRHRRAVA